MVPGHWYTVPHYATALPGSIVDFKIPNLGKKFGQKLPKYAHFGGFCLPGAKKVVQLAYKYKTTFP